MLRRKTRIVYFMSECYNCSNVHTMSAVISRLLVRRVQFQGVQMLPRQPDIPGL